MAKTRPGPSAARPRRTRDGAGFASPSVSDVLGAVRDCATELAQNRDPEVVAQAVVRRTRHLLAADMAYISLNDLLAGETFIRWTSGVRTQAYRTIRQPLGTGVLGMIAAGQPLAFTDRYLDDPVMIHVERIDQIVAAEGVVTVTGVPIRISGRVVGALLVASRKPATLTPKGQFALEQLATQAAIVLVQQQSGEELRRLQAALDTGARDTTARFADLADALALDEGLLELLSANGDTADMVEALAGRLGEPVGLWSPAGLLLAGAAQPGVGKGEAFHWRVSGAAQASFGAREPALLKLGDDDVAVMGVEVDGHHYGTLVASGAADAGKLAILRHGAAFVSASMAVRDAIARSDGRAASALVEDLVGVLEGRRPAGLARRLAQHGLSQNKAVAAFCVPAEEGAWPQALRALSGLSGDGKALVSPHRDHLCAIIATDEPDAAGRRLTAALKSAGAPGVVGLGVCPDTRPESMAAAHEDAVAAARAAATLGLAQGVYDAAALGVAGVLVGGTNSAVVERLV
ncbi:MAG: GAF domain-containing protein, partial [Propionibacteriaceae bacterium]|nr:GAF domain-containing protein [Propionibacteriaceae bacterium]